MLEDPASLQGKVWACSLYSSWRSKYTALWSAKSSESPFYVHHQLWTFWGDPCLKITPCRWRRQWQCCKPIRSRLRLLRSRSLPRSSCQPYLSSHSSIFVLPFYNICPLSILQCNHYFVNLSEALWMKELEVGYCLFTILWIAISWDVFDAVIKGDIILVVVWTVCPSQWRHLEQRYKQSVQKQNLKVMHCPCIHFYITVTFMCVIAERNEGLFSCNSFLPVSCVGELHARRIFKSLFWIMLKKKTCPRNYSAIPEKMEK